MFGRILTTLYKNTLYKNIEAQIGLKNENKLISYVQ